MGPLFRPSGGLRYHWRAWREGHNWESFGREIAQWLEGWPAHSDELILIGPSGGYTLPTHWLRQFEMIYAYDADPLAAFFFRRRHPGVRITFYRRDLFWENDQFNAQTVARVASSHPRAAILMSNVLGQLLLEHPVSEEHWERFLLELRTRLASREWASYHDLYTHENGEMIDHLLDGKWKDGLETAQFRWPLTRASQHIIEGVRNTL